MPVVIKRDGCKCNFDQSRIKEAVIAASKSAGIKDNQYALQVAQIIASEFADCDNVEIQTLQKAVENQLMSGPYKTVARHYIEYRHDRDVKRESFSSLNLEIRGLVEQSNEDLLNENANKNSRLIPTQRDLLAGIVSKHYAKYHMLPKDIVDAHEKGIIHYHDLDYSPFFPMFNCMLIDINGMLTKGFKMGNAEIESPRSISTATAVTAQIIAQVSSYIYGGNSINRIDEILEPYVTMSYEKHLKECLDLARNLCNNLSVEFTKKLELSCKEKAQKLTEKECYDSFQGLEYEINTLHTSNGQTPFCTFGFGLGTSWESRLIQKAILKVRIGGLGKNKKTAIFPKLVFSIKKGHNLEKDDPNYDIKQMALECASKRMYPDILNYDETVRVTGSFKAPMGCRSFLDCYKDKNGNEIHDGRNNLGVVSLNLPRIAIMAKGCEENFYQILDEHLAIARKALQTRIDRLKGVKAKVAPILYMEGACGVRLNPEDEVIKIFENGRASISLGYIGVYETINSLFGSEHHIFDSKELQSKAVKIVDYLKLAVKRWTDESGYGFSLYGTPSENLCNRFAKLDSKEFGIITGVTDKGYYTNSFHLDVEKAANPYDKIDFECNYPKLSSGGFICYGEYPNMQKNIEALEDVWNYSYNKIPYYGTNTPIDECYECGYTGEFSCTSKGFTCPKCGNHNPSKVSVTRRVCGYLGNPDARPFNAGKQEEVSRRVKHLPDMPI